MSSGFGLNGSVSRCYYHFEDFAKCMRVDADPLRGCVNFKNDYLECLHHKKEYLRRLEIDEEQATQKKLADNPNAKDGHGHGHH